MQWRMMVYYHSFSLNFILAQKLLGFQQLLLVHILSISHIIYNLSPQFLGGMCAVIAGICPVDIIGETTTISALITFVFVHISVIVVS
jgi:hypothetical protein